MSECFLLDIFARKLENKMVLMNKRQFFYNVIDKPDLLSIDCHFDNNILKNFCTGIFNFLTKHTNDILKELNLN